MAEIIPDGWSMAKNDEARVIVKTDQDLARAIKRAEFELNLAIREAAVHGLVSAVNVRGIERGGTTVPEVVVEVYKKIELPRPKEGKC